MLPIKYALHQLGVEFIEQTSLHNSVVSSAIFVLGFVLSATIADYKESECIPAEFASVIEDMYNDAKATHSLHPTFGLDAFRESLIVILKSFRQGTHLDRRESRRKVAALQALFVDMTSAGVPPNFVTRLKTQQAQLMRSLFRINYIQKIQFIPSAFLLIKLLVILIVGLLLVTNINPFFGGLFIVGAITFIMVYMLILIHHVSTPFQESGKSRDDVSLFLLRETLRFLQSEGRDATVPK